MLTSPHNPRIKQAARLRTRRGRQQQGRMLIDGPREVRRALEVGVRFVEVFVHAPRAGTRREGDAGQADAGQAEDLQGLRQQLLAARIPCWDVAPAVFEKIGYGDRNSGIVAVADTPRTDLAGWSGGPPTLVAVLEGLEKPGNVGAILRSADATGLDAVIVADPVTDLFNPNTIRASLGAVFSLPVFTADSPATRHWLRSQGLRIFVARVDGSLPLFEASLREPCAIVLGSEAAGVSTHWREADMQAVRLPMRGKVDSLNVSATASVIFYEALRQRSG